MAAIALPFLKGIVQKSPHQLFAVGLMRIVTFETIELFGQLVLVGLRHGRILHVVAIETERRRVLGQMILELAARLGPGLMRGMAGVATAIEGGMTASLGRYIQTRVMAGKTEIAILARA